MVIEEGIVAGNTYDKYGASNPIARFLMDRFLRDVHQLIKMAAPRDIHEVGCGEGHLTRTLCDYGVPLTASDFSTQIIEIARSQPADSGCRIDWRVASVYELTPGDAANLIVCCEVLEHLPDPERALEILHGLASPYCLVSVPREPLWRVLNLMRAKYVTALGNTPGHINTWGTNAFIRLLQDYFEIVELRAPLPWTIALCRKK